MIDPFIVAIYGATLSTALGFITIYNFIRDRRIIRVEKHFSFGLEGAEYDFVISNISSRPFTIIDCMISSFSETDKGKLELAWGVCPKRINSILGEDGRALDLPVLLHPGKVLIIRISSEDVVQQFQFDNRLDFGVNWSPTKVMMLEITHSMSQRIHEVRFELQMNELERSQRTEKSAATGTLRKAD